MKYQLLLLDIDGTLRPHGQTRVPEENVAAIRAVQRAGVRVAIATGRARASVGEALLNGLQPDLWLCAAGAQVLDAAGNALHTVTMTAEQVERLTAFCAEYAYPLRYSFSDGSHAYVGYEVFRAEELAADHGIALLDGGTRDRHRTELPFAAYGYIPRQAVCALPDLRFLYETDLACDILPLGVDKAAGLRALLEATGLTAAQCVAIGDSDNDAGMLRAAGLGLCVAGGSAAAKQAADALCPAAEENGVAQVCHALWPEVFA